MANQDDSVPPPKLFIHAVQKLDWVAATFGSTVRSAFEGARKRKIRKREGEWPEVILQSLATFGRQIGEPAQMDCRVQLFVDDDGLIVLPSGCFDDAALPYLRERLVEALADYPPFVCIDLTLVRCLGSSGIGLFESTRERVGRYDGVCSFTCGDSTMRRMFEDHGLVEVLHGDSGS
jgi:anti-anti-sigma regulatory factor